MKHRYIVLLSFIVVIMYAMMSFSRIDLSGNNDYNSINPDITIVRTYSWRLGGTTSIYVNSNSEATLTIDVTSYKASSTRPTEMCFVVNGNNVHAIDVSSTGIYTYNWHYNLNGEVHLSARYLCYQHLPNIYPSIIASLNPPPSGYSKFAEFGDASAYLPLTLPKTVLDYIGYDGNGSIYISNLAGAPGGLFYNIFNNFNITDCKSNYTKSGTADNSAIVGNTSYIELASGEDLYIYLNTTATGEGNRSCNMQITDAGSYKFCSEPCKLETIMQTETPNSNIKISLSRDGGYNVSGLNTNDIKEGKDFASLLIGALSTLAGPAALVLHEAKEGYSLYKCITSQNTDSLTGNKAVNVTYCITGGYMSDNKYSCVQSGNNVYSSATSGCIRIPVNELNKNFTFNITDETEYCCGGPKNTKQTASTTQTINAVTASAIYGEILNSNGQLYQKNTTLYLKNINNNNFYKIQVKNGHYLFFAKPNTEYKVYNPNLNQIYTIDASNLTAGNSFSHNIFNSEL